ncbi:MAG: hypothetical protein IH937_04390 [Acidobacteria bacterium]|nr:hypothetical protein [Acidobacteriota bacterium]
MFKRILKWVGGGLVAIVVTLALVLGLVLLFRTEPLAIIPGGRLSGEEVTVPVTDWSFTEQYTTVTLEVRSSDPYSVNTSSLLHDGVLYVPSGRGGESRWAQFLLQDSNMRLRVGHKLYKVRATRVINPMLIRELYEVWGQRYPSQAGRTAEEIAQLWFFRIDAR